ncbi:MAG: substrate-binding domain-containing protein [Peptococcaceae bacterium]|nr:substrate-binding domain-containing protein [Peptococcaceae bacterium]
MRKTLIVFGCLSLAIATLVVSIWLQYSDRRPPGTRDQTDNLNERITRSDNWSRIIEDPVVPESEIFIIDGSTATIPITAELLRQFYDYNDANVMASHITDHSTTHRAYLNLIHKTCRFSSVPTSLILVTPPSYEETSYAQSLGVELDLTPIACDGFVFITHKNNPVDSLSIEQIQDIYSGKITNWKQVGGKNKPIRAFQREPNSGSQTAMEQLVMEGKPIIPPLETTIEIIEFMGALVDVVAEYENGAASIGYTYNYYINNLYKNDSIKVLKINGISPDNENLINGSYPFTTNYYAVIRADEPTDSPARVLRDFLITEQGQSVIEMAGYCRAIDS